MMRPTSATPHNDYTEADVQDDEWMDQEEFRAPSIWPMVIGALIGGLTPLAALLYFLWREGLAWPF